MATNTNISYIKSPMNYTGGKFKLLPQIFPLFPDRIGTFVDAFGGGANVSVNVSWADKIIYNDILPQVVDFLKVCRVGSINQMLKRFDEIIEEYALTKENAEGYYELREFYNTFGTEWDYFYMLLCYAFNNQIRFNSKGEYNMPFGKGRSSFNPALRDKFIRFVEALQELEDIDFLCMDYKELPIDKLSEHDLFYADPPYLLTCATYNEQDGWNEKEELKLLETLDMIDFNGSRFALSNVLEHKGKKNEILEAWSLKYNVHHLNNTYANASYNTKDRRKNASKEVLITNY